MRKELLNNTDKQNTPHGELTNDFNSTAKNYRIYLLCKMLTPKICCKSDKFFSAVAKPLASPIYHKQTHKTDIARAGLTGQCYADDMHISVPATSASTIVQQFVACMECIDAWMSSNRLKMNAEDTADMDWYQTITSQAFSHRAIS